LKICPESFRDGNLRMPARPVCPARMIFRAGIRTGAYASNRFTQSADRQGFTTNDYRLTTNDFNNETLVTMKIKILTAALLSIVLLCSTARAQLVTNSGDTITIAKGTDLFIPGGFTLEDNGARFPYIQNDGTLEVSGDFIKSPNSIYSGGFDSVILIGKDSQRFPGFRYYRFLIDSGGAKTLNGKAFIRNQFLINRGLIFTNKDTIELDSVAIMKEDSTNYVTGNMLIKRKLRSDVNYQNGNIGLELQSLTLPPGNTAIFRKTGPDAIQHGFCTAGIARYFDVTPSAKLSAVMVFHYYPHELNGISKSNLAYFNSADKGITWDPLGYTSRDAVQGIVSLKPVIPKDRFTLADEFNPLIKPLYAGADTIICAGDSVQLGGDSTFGHDYSWISIPSGFSSNLSKPTVNPKVSTTYVLTEKVRATSCVNVDTVLVKVYPVANAKFSITPVTCSGFGFMADDSLQKNYAWNFGDGKTGTGSSIIHSFVNDSVYKVSLTVTNATGCISIHDSSFNFHARKLDYRIFPNPFRTATNINFNLCENAEVSITLWDELGRQIEVIKNNNLPEGFYSFPVDFSSHNWRPGMYFVRATINNQIIVNKIVRVK
jgi:hypothetical protein